MCKVYCLFRQFFGAWYPKQELENCLKRQQLYIFSQVLMVSQIIQYIKCLAALTNTYQVGRAFFLKFEKVQALILLAFTSVTVRYHPQAPSLQSCARPRPSRQIITILLKQQALASSAQTLIGLHNKKTHHNHNICLPYYDLRSASALCTLFCLSAQTLDIQTT